jgi:hypothetical protein
LRQDVQRTVRLGEFSYHLLGNSLYQGFSIAIFVNSDLEPIVVAS